MLLYFPEKFDENEITILIAVLLNYLIFRFLPKKIPREITPLIFLLCISFPKILDHTIAVTPHNSYDLTDSKRYEIFDIVLYFVYPAFGYVFVYFLDRIKGMVHVLYFLVWSGIAIGTEFIFTKLNVFHYHHWKLLYSFSIYNVVLVLTFLFFKFVMRQGDGSLASTDD